MKILWITNIPIGAINKALSGVARNGVWMSSMLEDFIQHRDHDIHIATTAAINQQVSVKENEVHYYAVPSQVPFQYDENKKENIMAWTKLLKDIYPDLIQVWGTECTHGLCALRIAKELGIPSVVYMQGYLGSIARYYFAGMTHKELIENVTLRDVMKRDSITQQQKQFQASTEKEKELIQLSGSFICENDWCDDSIKAVVPNSKSYRCPLNINNVFTKYTWSAKQAEPHSVVCTASGYPLKGLHMVLRAVALLKTNYRDIKLYIPGDKMISDGSVQWNLRKRGYTKYIEKLIKELKIQDNIVWMGYVTQDQLASQYSRTRAFVLSSSIENHSSSLKEAMMIGVPSVASAVGGVPEYVQHGENGFLYRFEEYEIMARYIGRIFEDDELACNISTNARKSMKNLHGSADIYNRMVEIYRDILEKKL